MPLNNVENDENKPIIVSSKKKKILQSKKVKTEKNEAEEVLIQKEEIKNPIR